MKKLLTILLSALLLFGALTGCKGANDGAATGTAAEPLAAGRYVETEIPLPAPPDGILNQSLRGLRREADGGMTMITSAYVGDGETEEFRYFRHTIAADGTVATGEERWLDALAPKGGNETHVLFAENGALYMIYSDYDDKGDSRAHILVSRDDGASGTELTGDGIGEMGMITSFGVLSDGRIAVANFYDGTLLLLDGEGNRLETLARDNKGRVNVCAASGGFVAYAVPDGKVVRVYHADDKTTAEYAYAFTELSMPQLAVAADGTVFLADNTGVYRHAAGGTIWEKLVDGETSTIGLPNFYAASLTVVADGTFPTFYVSDLDSLLAYRYDPALTATADKSLTVFSLRDNDTVRQAIVAFSRLRGDVKITYTVAMEGATGGTEQDYIKALNTELLAGTGPDILLLDGLPLDSYIEKDVLTELSDVLADTEKLQENVASAYQRDGKVYAVPTGFSVPLAVVKPGMEGAFESLSALADAAERAGEPPLLSPSAFSYRTLARTLYLYYGDVIRTGNAEAIEAFLRDAKRVAEAIGSTERLGDGWDALREMSQEEFYEMFADYFGSPQVFMAASGMTQSVLMQPVGSILYGMETFAVAERMGAGIVSVNGQFSPVGVVGVNKAGAEPEAADAFVRTLLSYAAQGGNQYAEQFPVNERALSEMLAYQNDGVSSGFMLNDGGEFTAMWPSKLWRDRLGALIASLDQPIADDAALTDMLTPAIEAYLSGASPLAEAAGRVESLLATYLSE